ncbi:hypothetical protein X975_07984, partial [Stegodyphus mimosarum]
MYCWMIKKLKLVLRSILSYIPPNEVRNAFIEQGFQVELVVQLTKSRGLEVVKMPLFLAILPRNDKNLTILYIEFLKQLRIRVEPYHSRQGPTQCYRYQGFHHMQSVLKLLPRCVKCGSDHYQPKNLYQTQK